MEDVKVEVTIIPWLCMSKYRNKRVLLPSTASCNPALLSQAWLTWKQMTAVGRRMFDKQQWITTARLEIFLAAWIVRKCGFAQKYSGERPRSGSNYERLKTSTFHISSVDVVEGWLARFTLVRFTFWSLAT